MPRRGSISEYNDFVGIEDEEETATAGCPISFSKCVMGLASYGVGMAVFAFFKDQQPFWSGAFLGSSVIISNTVIALKRPLKYDCQKIARVIAGILVASAGCGMGMLIDNYGPPFSDLKIPLCTLGVGLGSLTVSLY